MPDQPLPRRRFQFRLRTLMIAVTLLAVVCAAGSWLIHNGQRKYLEFDREQNLEWQYKDHLRRQAESAARQSKTPGSR